MPAARADALDVRIPVPIPGRIAMALALVSGALLPLGLAPFDWAPLGVLAFTGMLAALWGRSPRAALLIGWCVGVGRYGVGASWVYVSIHEHGGASVLLAGLMVALFVAFLALLPALAACAWSALRPDTPGRAVSALVATHVLLEWSLTWFLTGFPWLFAGYSQLGTPLAGWAPIVGLPGLSAITVATGAWFWWLLWMRGAGTAVRMTGMVIGLLWLIGAALAPVAWTRAQGRPLEVALVQGAVPQELKWRNETEDFIVARYVDLSAPHWAEADLVLWPEAALTVYARRSGALLDALGARAQATDTALVLGLPDYDFAPEAPREPILRNTAVALGVGEGRYVKQRLVPFGEYVPLESVLRGLIEFFNLPMSRARPGPADQALLRIGDGIGLSMAICYEIAYGNLVRTLSADASVIATISNDTWFGGSIGPSQHLQMAQMRALELGKPLVRATNDGITALVDHRGRIVDRLPRFEAGVLRGAVQPRSGRTPYARVGDLPALCFALGLLLALMLRGARPSTG